MPAQGPLFPTTSTSVAGAAPETAEAWVNPSNVNADDTSEATITAATYDSPDVSQILTTRGYGFTLPADAKVLGITAQVNRRSIVASSGKDYRVQLLDEAGALVGNNKADTVTVWGTTLATIAYGGAADTWGWTAIDASKVNDADFGLAVSAQANIANADVAIEWVALTVEYELAIPDLVIAPRRNA